MGIVDDTAGYHVQPVVKEARRTKKNYALWLGFALCTIYQSYRYPLQMGDTGTSPTYSDTPLIWQAGKFILALPLVAITAFRWFNSSARLPHRHWLIAMATVFLSSFSLLKMLGGYDSHYVAISFWMLFSLVLVLDVDFVSVSAIDKYLYILLAYAFGSTLVEVFLFLAFGRLPALAFAGSYLVRFGGFLDDPNAFAAILFLLMGWSFRRFSGRTRVLVLAGIVISLILSQSWTALFFFAAILFFYVLISALRRPLSALVTICALPMCAFFIVEWLLPRLQEGFLWDMMQDKQESIEQHLFPWDWWAARWPDWTLVGEWNYNGYESWWVSSMVNFGVIWLVAYLFLVMALLFCLLRTSPKAISRPIHAGLLLFGLYFAVGSLSLPFPSIFPVNALFFLLFFLVAFQKIAADNLEPARPRRLEPVESLSRQMVNEDCNTGS